MVTLSHLHDTVTVNDDLPGKRRGAGAVEDPSSGEGQYGSSGYILFVQVASASAAQTTNCETASTSPTWSTTDSVEPTQRPSVTSKHALSDPLSDDAPAPTRVVPGCLE